MFGLGLEVGLEVKRVVEWGNGKGDRDGDGGESDGDGGESGDEVGEWGSEEWVEWMKGGEGR